MKKIFQLTTLLAMVLVAFSCAKTEVLTTDQYDSAVVALKAYGPQPVVRGGVLRFVGSNLDKVVSVTIPGVDPLTPEVVTAGVHSEIRVTVPKDGPEPGFPVLTLADGGTLTGKTLLTYSEPIILEGFSPLSVYPGDKITITGDYLNLIHEVIYEGDVIVGEEDFMEHTRYKIVVGVPAEARTGKIALGTVDQTQIDETTDEGAALLATLNLIESEDELTVGTATGTFPEEAIKAGSVVTITGSHLMLTEEIQMGNYTVSEFDGDNSAISFELSPEVSDCEVLLIMGSGVEVPIGTLTTLAPVVSGVTPAPVKNGATVTIAGSDLDLVTGLSFPNSEWAEFTYAEGVITATVTEAAQEGDLTLHMANGKTVTADIDLVKPVVTSFSANPASAGSDVTINGTDLDLVKSVTFGGGITVDVEATETAITVAVPTAAETAVLVLNLKNGSSVESIELAIDKPAGAYIATFPEDLYAPGAVFVVELENADKLTGVQIDGADVTYILSGSTLYVSIPDNAKRGSQITLLSAEGNVTYTMNIDPGDIIETTLWSGSLEIAGWANNEMKPNDIFVGVEMKEGQTIRFYGTFADWWCIKMFDGHWNPLPTGAGDEEPNMISKRVQPEAGEQGFFSLTLTADMIQKFQNDIDWGYWGVIQGEGISLSKITYYEDNSIGEVVWEGSLEIAGWANNEMKPNDIFVGVEMKAGQQVRFYGTFSDWWCIKMFDGHWNALSTGAGDEEPNMISKRVQPEAVDQGYFTLTLTDDIIQKFQNDIDWGYWGVIQGEGIVLSKITVK